MKTTVSKDIREGEEGGLLHAQLCYLDLHQYNERKSEEMGEVPRQMQDPLEMGKEHACGAQAAALAHTGEVDCCNLSFSVQVCKKWFHILVSEHQGDRSVAYAQPGPGGFPRALRPGV